MNQKTHDKTLLYLTSWYPCNKGDSAFIATEIKYLCQNFDKIIVVSNGNIGDNLVKNIPENVFYHFFPKLSKIEIYATSFFCLFQKEFYKELYYLLKNGISLSRFRFMVGFLSGALCKKRFLKKILRNTQVSICYSFWYWSDTLATLLHFKNSVPVVTRTHRFDLYKFRHNHRYQPFKFQMDKLLKNIHFISQQGLEYYKQHFAQSQEQKYSLSYLGTENEAPYVFKYDNRELSLVSCSNIIPVKRIEIIIDTLAICSSINIKWTHIGDGTECERIQNYAKEKLENTCIKYHFLGYQENTKVKKYYENHYVDLFINVSESEGLPVSMMEAMSFGIPVCGTDVGGVKEIVDDSCGFLLSADYSSCVNDLVASIQKYISFSTVDKQSLHDNAYKKWKDKFNAKENYNQFVTKLLSICE